MVTLAVLLVPTSAAADEYVRAFSDSVIYIAWTEDQTGQIRGQVQLVNVDPADHAHLKSYNASFSGVKNGANISISFPILSNFSGQTWTGTVGWRELRLVVPSNASIAEETLYPGTLQDFQQAEGRLSRAAAAVRSQQQQAESAQREQQQRTAAYNQTKFALTRDVNQAAEKLNDARRSITSALKNLHSEFASSTQGPAHISAHYEQAWQKMQQHWVQEQAASSVFPMTCYQKSQVEYTASEVAYELSEIKYVDSEVDYFANWTKGDFNDIASGLAATQIWAPIYDQRYVAYSGFITGTPSNPNFTKKVSSFRASSLSEVARYRAQLRATLDMRTAYDQKATELNNKAKALPPTLVCE